LQVSDRGLLCRVRCTCTDKVTKWSPIGHIAFAPILGTVSGAALYGGSRRPVSIARTGKAAAARSTAARPGAPHFMLLLPLAGGVQAVARNPLGKSH